MIRPLFDEFLIELRVQLRRGDGEVRLADDDEKLRHAGDLRQQLAAAFDLRRAAEDAERHVAADRLARLAEGRDGKRLAIIAIESAQDCRRVSAAAAESCFRRDALVDENFKAAGPLAGAGKKRLGSTPRKVVRILWESVCFKPDFRLLRLRVFDDLTVAMHRPRGIGVNIDDHIVPEGDGLHDGADVMIAVRALAQNVQRQVDLCKCAFGDDFHYLIFLPSR